MEKINSLLDFLHYFKMENICLKFLKKQRFKNGEFCPHCNHNKIYTFRDKRTYKCAKCRKFFTLKVGTIFDSSKVSLKKWFLAIFLLNNNHKGISSTQLAEQIGVTQKTAWFMAQRIRETYKQNKRLLGKIFEVDETYIGGKERNKHINKKHKISKEAVLGVVARKGELKLKHIGETNTYTVSKELCNKFNKKSVVITDETKIYDKVLYNVNRRVVNHSKKEYVLNGDIYTNTIENTFGIVKRTLYGIYHKVSKKHLQRYLNEIAFRFNNRGKDNSNKMELCLCNINNRLKYNELIKG